jgi:DNA-binding XRE family transcriptional regulator
MTAKRRALADRRKAAGCTQEQLAAVLGAECSTVVCWEAGETEPLPWCRPKLAEVLSVSLDVLHDLLAEPEDLQRQPGDALLVSLLGDVTSAQSACLWNGSWPWTLPVPLCREVLQELALMSGVVLWQPVRRWLAQALTVVPLVFPDSVSNEALDARERAIMLFRRWDASGVGGLRRKAVVGQLTAVAESLRDSHSPELSWRLFHGTAELAQLAGWMAYDQGLSGVAQRYYWLGLSASRKARSPVLRAKY